MHIPNVLFDSHIWFWGFFTLLDTLAHGAPRRSRKKGLSRCSAGMGLMGFRLPSGNDGDNCVLSISLRCATAFGCKDSVQLFLHVHKEWLSILSVSPDFLSAISLLRICFVLSLSLSLLKSKIAKNSQKNSQRISKEFPINFKRILKEFSKNSQTIHQKFWKFSSKNSPKHLKKFQKNPKKIWLALIGRNLFRACFNLA